MKKTVLTLIMATIAGSLTFGAAASLEIGAADLGSGTATVESCDPDDGITVGYTLNGEDPSLVDKLVLTNIDAACGGQEIAWSVFDIAEDGTRTAVRSGGFSLSGTGSDDINLVDITEGPLPADAIDEIAFTITGITP